MPWISSRNAGQSPLRFIPPFAFFAPLREIYFIILLFLCGSSSFAQQYSFKNYTVANGLGSSSVNHIFQDSKGYLWFATQGGGASRFNGSAFQNFTKADGLVNNDVTYITEDNKGNIWIATAGGVSEFNGIAFHNYTGKEGITDGVVYAIHADEQNKIWFATQDNGIKIYDGSTFDSLTTANGLSTNEIYCIAQDTSGNYWFGLANGIAKYQDGKIFSYADSTPIKGYAYFSVFADKNNTVWFGSIGNGVVKITNENQIQKLELPAVLQNDFIGGIAQDKKGNSWFATDHGLLKYYGKEFKLFSEQEGLSVNVAQTVYCDYEGNIWTGTLGGGVNLLSSEAFVHYTDKHGLASKNITCIHPAGHNATYYIGTGEGVYVFKPAENQFNKISGIEEIEHANITSLSVDANENLWLCAQEGIFILNKQGSRFTLSKKYDAIAGERIVSPTKVIHDTKGNCWIATYGSGIFMLNEKTEKVFSTKTGFISDKILTLYEDSRGTIWAGTQDASVFIFDGAAFQSITMQQNAADKSAWTITEDDAGNIYWGSGESGIYRYDGNQVNASTENEGLLTNFISTLAWDKGDNSLWSGSETGIQKIIFSAQGVVQDAHTYTELDGFHTAGINPGSLLLTNERALLIGTQNGLWLFDSKKDYPKDIPLKIQLTGIRLFYQTTDWKQFNDSLNSSTQLPVELELPYNKNHLTFDIQALTVQDVRYTFMLEGADAQWTQPAKNNEITFTNIAPGDYTFKAKAVSSQGMSSDETISFSFTVHPPWWNTWWFRILAFFTAIALLITFIKTRERILKEQYIKLEATVQERTLEIAQQKKVVEKMLAEKETLLKEIHHRVKNNLQTISSMLMLQSAGLKDEQAKKAIAESQSRVRSIALVHQKLYQTDGLEKVELNAFIKDLAEQVKSFYRQQAQAITVSTSVPEAFILIDAAIPIGLILNELLTNSFKYAFSENTSGEITIQLQFEGTIPTQTNGLMRRRKARLSYADSGTGFDFSKVGTNSLGLRLVKLLSQQIGAALEYSNTNGSEFLFTFELNA